MTENSAKGRTSFDSTSTGSLIAFFNRNVQPYPTEVGGPRFELVPVREQKDLMLNTARMYAKQEYDRIMQMVDILEQQAQAINRRLVLTEQVYAAEYKFQTTPGNIYWLIADTSAECTRLSIMGPNDWATGIPTQYEYLARVKYLGDHTWCEVDEHGNPL